MRKRVCLPIVAAGRSTLMHKAPNPSRIGSRPIAAAGTRVFHAKTADYERESPMIEKEKSGSVRRAARAILLVAGASRLFGCASGGEDASGVDVDASQTPDGSQGAHDASSNDVSSDASMMDASDASTTDASDGSTMDVQADVTDAAACSDAAPSLMLSGTQITPNPLIGHPNSVGGTTYNDECPAGYVATGMNLWLRGSALYPGPTQVICSEIHLTGTGPYGISIGPGQLTPPLPQRDTETPADTAQSRNCDPDQVIVSFKGRYGAAYDALTFYCAPLIVSPTCPYTVSIGTATALQEVGDVYNPPYAGGNPFPLQNCPTGQIAKGFATRHDGDPGFQLAHVLLDAVGMICTTPLVQ
jgi:hypothetical protein